MSSSDPRGKRSDGMCRIFSKSMKELGQHTNVGNKPHERTKSHDAISGKAGIQTPRHSEICEPASHIGPGVTGESKTEVNGNANLVSVGKTRSEYGKKKAHTSPKKASRWKPQPYQRKYSGHNKPNIFVQSKQKEKTEISSDDLKSNENNNGDKNGESQNCFNNDILPKVQCKIETTAIEQSNETCTKLGQFQSSSAKLEPFQSLQEKPFVLDVKEDWSFELINLDEALPEKTVSNLCETNGENCLKSDLAHTVVATKQNEESVIETSTSSEKLNTCSTKSDKILIKTKSEIIDHETGEESDWTESKIVIPLQSTPKKELGKNTDLNTLELSFECINDAVDDSGKEKEVIKVQESKCCMAIGKNEKLERMDSQTESAETELIAKKHEVKKRNAKDYVKELKFNATDKIADELKPENKSKPMWKPSCPVPSKTVFHNSVSSQNEQRSKYTGRHTHYVSEVAQNRNDVKRKSPIHSLANCVDIPPRFRTKNMKHDTNQHKHVTNDYRPRLYNKRDSGPINGSVRVISGQGHSRSRGGFGQPSIDFHKGKNESDLHRSDVDRRDRIAFKKNFVQNNGSSEKSISDAENTNLDIQQKIEAKIQEFVTKKGEPTHTHEVKTFESRQENKKYFGFKNDPVENKRAHDKNKWVYSTTEDWGSEISDAKMKVENEVGTNKQRSGDQFETNSDKLGPLEMENVPESVNKPDNENKDLKQDFNDNIDSVNSFKQGQGNVDSFSVNSQISEVGEVKDVAVESETNELAKQENILCEPYLPPPPPVEDGDTSLCSEPEQGSARTDQRNENPQTESTNKSESGKDKIENEASVESELVDEKESMDHNVKVDEINTECDDRQFEFNKVFGHLINDAVKNIMASDELPKLRKDELTVEVGKVEGRFNETNTDESKTEVASVSKASAATICAWYDDLTTEDTVSVSSIRTQPGGVSLDMASETEVSDIPLDEVEDILTDRKDVNETGSEVYFSLKSESEGLRKGDADSSSSCGSVKSTVDDNYQADFDNDYDAERKGDGMNGTERTEENRHEVYRNVYPYKEENYMSDWNQFPSFGHNFPENQHEYELYQQYCYELRTQQAWNMYLWQMQGFAGPTSPYYTDDLIQENNLRTRNDSGNSGISFGQEVDFERKRSRNISETSDSDARYPLHSKARKNWPHGERDKLMHGRKAEIKETIGNSVKCEKRDFSEQVPSAIVDQEKVTEKDSECRSTMTSALGAMNRINDKTGYAGHTYSTERRNSEDQVFNCKPKKRGAMIEKNAHPSERTYKWVDNLDSDAISKTADDLIDTKKVVCETDNFIKTDNEKTCGLDKDVMSKTDGFDGVNASVKRNVTDGCLCKPENVQYMVWRVCKCAAGPKLQQILPKMPREGSVDLGYQSYEYLEHDDGGLHGKFSNWSPFCSTPLVEGKEVVVEHPGRARGKTPPPPGFIGTSVQEKDLKHPEANPVNTPGDADRSDTSTTIPGYTNLPGCLVNSAVHLAKAVSGLDKAGSAEINLDSALRSASRRIEEFRKQMEMEEIDLENNPHVQNASGQNGSSSRETNIAGIPTTDVNWNKLTINSVLSGNTVKSGVEEALDKKLDSVKSAAVRTGDLNNNRVTPVQNGPKPAVNLLEKIRVRPRSLNDTCDSSVSALRSDGYSADSGEESVVRYHINSQSPETGLNVSKDSNGSLKELVNRINQTTGRNDFKSQSGSKTFDSEKENMNMEATDSDDLEEGEIPEHEIVEQQRLLFKPKGAATSAVSPRSSEGVRCRFDMFSRARAPYRPNVPGYGMVGMPPPLLRTPPPPPHFQEYPYDPRIMDPRIMDPRLNDPSRMMDPRLIDPSRMMDPRLMDPSRIMDLRLMDPSRIMDPRLMDPSKMMDPRVVENRMHHPLMPGMPSLNQRTIAEKYRTQGVGEQSKHPGSVEQPRMPYYYSPYPYPMYPEQPARAPEMRARDPQVENYPESHPRIENYPESHPRIENYPESHHRIDNYPESYPRTLAVNLTPKTGFESQNTSNEKRHSATGTKSKERLKLVEYGSSEEDSSDIEPFDFDVLKKTNKDTHNKVSGYIPVERDTYEPRRPTPKKLKVDVADIPLPDELDSLNRTNSEGTSASRGGLRFSRNLPKKLKQKTLKSFSAQTPQLLNTDNMASKELTPSKHTPSNQTPSKQTGSTLSKAKKKTLADIVGAVYHNSNYPEYKNSPAVASMKPELPKHKTLADIVGAKPELPTPGSADISTMPPFPGSTFWNMYNSENTPGKCSETENQPKKETPKYNQNWPRSNRFSYSPSRNCSWGFNSPSEPNSTAQKGVLVDWKTNFTQFHNFGVKYIDTHCHLDFLFKREGFNGNLESYREKYPELFPDGFEGCVAVFCNPASFIPQGGLWQEVAKEANVWIAMGCHPKMATDFDTVAEAGLKRCLKHNKCIALGEIGLDYSGSFQQHEEIQKRVFRVQLEMAVAARKPLVIHCRQAEEDCLEIMKELVPRNYKIHCHCFTSWYYNARLWLDAFPNLYIGVTPLVTYTSAKPVHDLARNIPIDRLLLETDAPYFVPRCIPRDDVKYSSPGLAITVAKEIAQYQELPVAAVLRQCRLNTKFVYGI